jgi:hypothetical protein
MTQVFFGFFNCCYLLDLLWLINIKLVRNWAFEFSMSLGFNGSRVWDLYPNLEDLSEFFLVFFFSLLKLFFFQFYHLTFISLLIKLFFCLSAFDMIFLIVHFFSFPFFVYPYINLFSQSFLCPESYYFFKKIKHACIIKLQMFFSISPSFISFPYKIQSLIFLLLFILFRIIFIFFFKTSSFTGFFPINFRKKKCLVVAKHGTQF